MDARLPRGAWRLPRPSHLVLLLARLVLVALFLLPLVLGLAAAFRPEGETFRYLDRLSINTFLPAAPTLDNFRAALARQHFVRQVGNTFLAGLVQPTVTVALATLAAFPLARMRFRGRETVLYAILVTMFIPLEAILVPLFLVVRDFNMLDTFHGLILPWVASPIAVFLLRQAMAEIPRDLDEAAMLDGAGLWEILRTVIVPNILPAMATVWLITFAFVWDSYLWPLVVIDSPEKQVAQVGIAGLFNTMQRVEFGTVFASTVIAIGPVLVAFLALQRFYVSGVAMTGINK